MDDLPRLGIISRSTLNLSQSIIPLLDYHKMMRKEFVTMGLKLVLGKMISKASTISQWGNLRVNSAIKSSTAGVHYLLMELIAKAKSSLLTKSFSAY
jgi:hypothetical protein